MKSPSHFLNSHREKNSEPTVDFNFGVQITPNKNLRSHRFKSQMIINNDVDKANQIDKDKLRKSLAQMNEHDDRSKSPDKDKSPEAQEQTHRSQSTEKESIQNTSFNSNKITTSVLSKNHSQLTNLKSKKLKKYSVKNPSGLSSDSVISSKRQSIISIKKDSILGIEQMFTTNKSKEMYERNKILRYRMEQNLKVRLGERLSSNESELSQRSNLRNLSTSSIESVNKNLKFNRNNSNLSSDSLKIKSLTKNGYMNIIKDEDEFIAENESLNDNTITDEEDIKNVTKDKNKNGIKNENT